jgi:hypothetical protein
MPRPSHSWQSLSPRPKRCWRTRAMTVIAPEKACLSAASCRQFRLARTARCQSISRIAALETATVSSACSASSGKSAA